MVTRIVMVVVLCYCVAFNSLASATTNSRLDTMVPGFEFGQGTRHYPTMEFGELHLQGLKIHTQERFVRDKAQIVVQVSFNALTHGTLTMGPFELDLSLDNIDKLTWQHAKARWQHLLAKYHNNAVSWQHLSQIYHVLFTAGGHVKINHLAMTTPRLKLAMQAKIKHDKVQAHPLNIAKLDFNIKHISFKHKGQTIHFENFKYHYDSQVDNGYAHSQVHATLQRLRINSSELGPFTLDLNIKNLNLRSLNWLLTSGLNVIKTKSRDYRQVIRLRQHIANLISHGLTINIKQFSVDSGLGKTAISGEVKIAELNPLLISKMSLLNALDIRLTFSGPKALSNGFIRGYLKRSYSKKYHQQLQTLSISERQKFIRNKIKQQIKDWISEGYLVDNKDYYHFDLVYKKHHLAINGISPEKDNIITRQYRQLYKTNNQHDKRTLIQALKKPSKLSIPLQHQRQQRIQEMIKIVEHYKIAVNACAQAQKHLKNCDMGKLHIPIFKADNNLLGNTVKSIKVTNGVITLTPKATPELQISEKDTIIAKPNLNDQLITWHYSGGALVKLQAKLP